MMQKKVIIFGNTKFSKLIKWYIENDTDRELVGFTVEKEYLTEKIFEGFNVVPFDKIEDEYDPRDYEILIAIGYSNMNSIREKIYYKIKEKGYDVASYYHSSSINQAHKIGEGNIILEGNVIQPFVEIGNCNLIWYNTSIAHDVSIGNFNTFAGSSSLSGFVQIGNNCFIGNNSTIKDKIDIADYTLVGAGSYISKSTNPYDVIVPVKSIKLPHKKSVDCSKLWADKE